MPKLMLATETETRDQRQENRTFGWSRSLDISRRRSFNPQLSGLHVAAVFELSELSSSRTATARKRKTGMKT